MHMGRICSRMTSKTQTCFPKINKSNTSGTMETIKKYVRSCCDVMRVPLAYIIRKIIVIGTYGIYPW